MAICSSGSRTTEEPVLFTMEWPVNPMEWPDSQPDPMEWPDSRPVDLEDEWQDSQPVTTASAADKTAGEVQESTGFLGLPFLEPQQGEEHGCEPESGQAWKRPKIVSKGRDLILWVEDMPFVNRHTDGLIYCGKAQMYLIYTSLNPKKRKACCTMLTCVQCYEDTCGCPCHALQRRISQAEK